MNDKSNVADFAQRLKAKAEQTAEMKAQLDLEFHIIPLIADFINDLRSEGADDETIAKLLRHAADELNRS